MDYKELIEKEANKYFVSIDKEDKRFDSNYKFNDYEIQLTCFKDGINSELNKRIIEIEKRKYALGLLKELNNLIEWENGKMYNKLSTDIIVLEQEISNLEKEIK